MAWGRCRSLTQLGSFSDLHFTKLGVFCNALFAVDSGADSGDLCVCCGRCGLAGQELCGSVLGLELRSCCWSVPSWMLPGCCRAPW